MNIDEMSLEELLDLAADKGIEPCDFCKYTDECNHCPINCYGGHPIESPCVSNPDMWVDEDELRERLTEACMEVD